MPLSSNFQENQSAPLIYQLQLVTVSPECNEFKDCQTEPKMFVSEDIFELCLDGASIEDNGRLVVHSKGNHAVEVRGKVGYSSGIHRFRLHFEKSSLGTWIFIGIISDSTSMAKNSFGSSSSYGWADYDDFFVAGIRQNNQTTGQFTHAA